MSIPLDRLYHYIKTISEEIYGTPVIIYRFYPHGSKKLEDLVPLKYYSWQDLSTTIGVICNDQEPLDYLFYKNYNYNNNHSEFYELCKSLSALPETNFKNFGIYNQSILLHSEKRSKNLQEYQQNQYIPIYYWNHAILSLDWFRYANHIQISKNPTKKFLIYNRAWSGTREYRLKFADLLVEYNLLDHCQTSVGFTDQNIHYTKHKFHNANWQPQHALENYFNPNLTASTNSADFSIEDYTNTDIEVVLETLFDDDRLHLTEKSLRPIACGQPFILAATHGSLEYLQSYGFKTFDTVFDESYDAIEDPKKRLQAIVLLLQQIANWNDLERSYKMNQLQQIADFNREHFFSNNFFNQVINELKENVKSAFNTFQSTKNCTHWLSRWDQLLMHQSVIDFLENNQIDFLPTKTQLKIVYEKAKNTSCVRQS
jgi:hypothetical protein